MIVSAFTSRILVPLVYYPFYFLLVFGLVTKNVTKLHRNHALILLTIFLIYIIHLPNVKDLSSNFIYTCLWVINIFISVFIFNLKNTEVIEKSLACFGIILIASFIPLNFLGIHPVNYYGSIGFNINLVVFFVTFSIFYFFKISKSYGVSKYFLASLSLLTGSRMHILMYLAYIGMRYRFILYLSLLFFVIAVIYLLPGISVYSDVANYFLTGQFSFTEKFDDTRRIYLAIAAIESLKNTFPLGSGFGLENYVQFAGF